MHFTKWTPSFRSAALRAASVRVFDLLRFVLAHECKIKVTALLIMLLLPLTFSELFLYRSSETEYQYSVDSTARGDLQINIDLSVAIPCESAIGSAPFVSTHPPLLGRRDR